MHLVTVILGVLLFPKALSALRCYDSECMETGTGACTETQRDCPASMQQCGATTVRTSAGWVNVDVKMKSCMPSAGCGLSGSVNFGISRTSTITTCCSTALCNVQYPTPPASTSANGKRCYTCNNDDCSTILSCSGDEDRCISTRVELYGGNEMTMKGCISKSLCVSTHANDIILGVSTQMSCCEGDLCNSTTSTSATTTRASTASATTTRATTASATTTSATTTSATTTSATTTSATTTSATTTSTAASLLILAATVASVALFN